MPTTMRGGWRALAVVVAPLLAVVCLPPAWAGAAARERGAGAAAQSWVPWISSTGAEVGCTKNSTDAFGICEGHHSYDAIDFLLPGGTQLIAPMGGTVAEILSTCADEYSSCGGGHGNFVRIAGDDGIHYLLAHLRSVSVSAGQDVVAGDPVGLVGRSGSTTTNHVHYEERSASGARLVPGSMLGRQADGTVATYPAELGYGSWYSVPSHDDQMVVNTGVPPQPCLDEFSDVYVGSAFCDDIGWMVGEGITAGYADGTFRPLDPVSRQAMAMFLHRATPHGAEAIDDPGFTDVATSSAFHHPIAWVVDRGIAEGYGDGTFRPLEPLTRQAMISFLWRRAGSPGGFPSAGFLDVPSDHPFAAAIDWAEATGVTEGFPDGTFRPGATMSRQAMAAFLHRILV